ncbi:hypothetical protein VTJ49DRAFT_2472 [Mycothermus thermophilus]|uniref:GAR domain-containing protein n=1 Tax=Humicola insolens TaxID=85995 RepID=A0ABR3V9U3_HUMIN
MNEHALTPRLPSHYVPTRGRHLRSASTSPLPPALHTTDDLLSHLTTPRAVVDALRNPSGTLKACIEAASPTEQAFALRVAMASNSIYEWLEELSAWPWPAGGGSGGFETPAVRRKLFSSGDSASSSDAGYTGSLPTAEVEKYARRIDDISRELDELNIEEIKSQVLNNHILPLSRPGTPIMGVSSRSITSSFGSIAKLDDLAALVTATTVQALPNLSKLTRLMAAWSFRLIVLRKIPVFMASLTDAEVALRSGWNAVGLGIDGRPVAATAVSGMPSATLTRADFDVMRCVIGSKVAKAGRDLDSMLDVLEGQPDTLPEDWIDRVDALERGYGEWTVACEKKVKEADLMRATQQLAPRVPASTAQKTPRDASTPMIKVHPSAEDQNTAKAEDEYLDADNQYLDGLQPPAIIRSQLKDTIPEDREWSAQNSDSEASESSGPTVPGRRNSNVSDSSTIIHDAPSMTDDSFSSDVLDRGTPDRRPQTAPACDNTADLGSSFQSGTRSLSVSFSEMPTVREVPSLPSLPGTPRTRSFVEDDDDLPTEPNTPIEDVSMLHGVADDRLQQQISEILSSVPAKIRLTANPAAVNLNPPDFKMPKRKSSRQDLIPRSQSNASMRSTYSRSATPSFTLAPAQTRSRSKSKHTNQEIRLYHLSRAGEAPIKLFIRCVGERGERVMVRVGGGWADLGEYLKEYALHHRRAAAPAAEEKVEVKDIPAPGAVRPVDSTPPSRPSSAMDVHSPISPLRLRKVRRPAGEASPGGPAATPGNPPPAVRPKTPLAGSSRIDATPPSDGSSGSSYVLRSRASSNCWIEDGVPGNGDGAGLADVTPPPPLGMAGPRAKQIRMSEESRAWVQSVTEKVRIASGERRVSSSAGVGMGPPLGAINPNLVGSGPAGPVGAAAQGAATIGSGGLEASLMDRGPGAAAAPMMFKEMGKVGSTKRVFLRKAL